MPGHDYAQIAEQMTLSGMSGETSCLIVSKACTSQQQVCVTNLRELALVAPLPPPAVMLIGNVSGIAPKLRNDNCNDHEHFHSVLAAGRN